MPAEQAGSPDARLPGARGSAHSSHSARGGHLAARPEHELRAPLASIHFALQLALAGSGELLRSEDREILEISIRSTERLVHRVEELLEVSAVERRQAPAAFDPVAVAPLVEEAGRAMRPMALGRSVSIAIACEADLPPVDADRNALGRVLANLLANAIECSPRGQRVTLSATRVGSEVEFAVTDGGSSIGSWRADALPGTVSTIAPWSKLTGRGTGLGLAVCQAIVEQHGGRMSIVPLGAGGSRFAFALPTAPAAPCDDTPSDSANPRPALPAMTPPPGAVS